MFSPRPSDTTEEQVQTRQIERPASRHDDFAGNTTSTGRITGEAAFRGDLEDSGDRDWFQVQLVAGQTYTLSMEGTGTNAGTLTDPFLVLRDASGAFVSQDDNSGTGNNASLTFTPTTSGTYWLEARSIAASNDTGTYTVSATTGAAGSSGTNGVIVNGTDPQDQSGRSVSTVGDVNGDGIDDLIIGAAGGDPNSNVDAGETFVVFGNATGIGSSGSINLSSLNGTNGFVINGIDAGDQSGFSVSNAGDVNGDGIDDLIIGARSADPNGNSSGESYVVFGATNIGATGAISLAALDGTNGFVINGIGSKDESGWSVSAAGDVNGDGIADLIIGARAGDPNGNNSGESYVVLGATTIGSTGTIQLSALNGTNGFVINGIDSKDYSGWSVSAAGDVNGDGFDDVIIGALAADPNGNSSGESYVILGAPTVGGAGPIELSALNGTNGFVINGIDANDYSGFSVSAAGDINGDGLDDLIIGATGGDPNGNADAGESYVVFGASNIGGNGVVFLSNLNGTNGFVINGIDAGDGSGFTVSAAGDVNGDGFDDIIIGAASADPAGNTDAGESYVVFGSLTVGSSGVIQLSALDGTNGFVINGVDAGDASGFSVSAAGDVNNDGYGDLIIGATGGSPGTSNRAGESFIVYGNATIGNTGAVNLSDLVGQSTSASTSAARTASTENDDEGYVTTANTLDANIPAIVDDTLLT